VLAFSVSFIECALHTVHCGIAATPVEMKINKYGKWEVCVRKIIRYSSKM